MAYRFSSSRARLTLAAGLLTAVLAGVLLAGCRRPAARPNVLVITIDTLRADHVGSYGFKLARTPTMDRLAAEGVRCADAISAAPITMPSHSTIFTGLFPPAHGVRDNGSYALGDDAVTLAERLKKVGYRTQAIVSAIVLSRRYNLSQGFDGYDDDLWAEDDPRLFMIRSRPGPKTAARAVRWLRAWQRENAGTDPKPRAATASVMAGARPKTAPPKPFFLWVHFFDAHQPYSASPADLALSPTPYDGEITVADRGVGTILAELERQGVLDDTLVVLTADHGESLGEHGEKTHAVFIYDATVRVPLFFRFPGALPRGKTYAGPVRSVDIVPTVLALLNLPGGGETQGTDLGPAFRGDVPPPDLPQYSESLLSEVGFGMAPLYGVRQDGTKWIRAPKPEVYDLKRDPREVSNLYPREARRGAILDRTLQGLLDDSRRRALKPRANAMDHETQEALQALGYLAPRAQREAVTGMDPKDGMPLYNKVEEARHLAQQERWAESEKLLREVMAVTPKNLSAQNILALTRLKQEDFEGAKKEYQHSLALDPGQFRVYGMLGTLDLLAGDLDGAEKEYRRGLAVSPGFVEAMSNLGMLADLRGNPQLAQEWYRKAIAADPTFPRVWRRLGDLYYERNDYPQALANYRKALAITPDDFEAMLQAGSSARHAGDARAAARYFFQAERLRPDSWLPPYNLACLRAAEGEPGRAARLLGLSLHRGFRQPELLEQDPDLAAVRARPEYPDLLARARKRAQEPAPPEPAAGPNRRRRHRRPLQTPAPVAPPSPAASR
jgi:arylsulfatase A-like enzyme/Flp pilus assembly protein TadD